MHCIPINMPISLAGPFIQSSTVYFVRATELLRLRISIWKFSGRQVTFDNTIFKITCKAAENERVKRGLVKEIRALLRQRKL
jgi:hypothetical protein